MAYLNNRGSTTIFMGVVMPVVIGACILLSDVCLYDSGKRIIENSANASAHSILGRYSGYLKENYDLYAFCMSDERAMALAGDNLLKNLDDSKMFDFKIEEISIEKSKCINNRKVLLGMLEKAAPDDVYQSMADEFLERFDILSGLSGAAGIITLKMKMDKAYQKIKDSMTALEKIINGGDNLKYYVNLAGLNTDFAEAVDTFNKYRFELAGIKSEIEQLTLEIEGEPSEKAGIKMLLEEQAGVLREKAADVYMEFIEGAVNGLKEANKIAVGYIRDIFIENMNIHVLSDAIKDNVETINDCPDYLKEILYTCTELVSDVEEAFVEQVFEEISIELNRNISMLSELETVFETTIEGEDEDLSKEISDAAAKYNTGVIYVYNEELIAGRDRDKRSFFEELGKKVLEKQIGKDKCIEESVMLPSMGTDSNNREFKVTSLGEDTKSGENEINEFSSSVIAPGRAMLRNLLVNEYIMQHFASENSRSEERVAGSFFKNETEYILWGAKSQNANIFFTKAAIMSTRFALDAIHVYTDSGKIAKANAIAAATAGWWTMGAGIPVMSNLVKISWAIAEAGIDTRKLWQGQSIPIIKTAGDWITDIGTGSAGMKSPGFLKMDYNDYLRLYLMAIPMDKKIIRLLDIISLNSRGYFNVFNTYTEVTVTVLVSYRSLTGGRHEVEVSATQSY